MKTSEELKKMVQDKYGEIVEKSATRSSCGCCSTSEKDYTVFSSDNASLEGYNP